MSKSNKNSNNLSIPINKIQKETSERESNKVGSLFTEVQGAPEVVALMTGNLSNEHHAKALDIIEKRIDYNENERNRHFKAFKFDISIKGLLFIVIFFSLLGITVYLYYIGNNNVANHLISAIASSVLGFMAGMGYQKTKS